MFDKETAENQVKQRLIEEGVALATLTERGPNLTEKVGQFVEKIFAASEASLVRATPETPVYDAENHMLSWQGRIVRRWGRASSG